MAEIRSATPQIGFPAQQAPGSTEARSVGSASPGSSGFARPRIIESPQPTYTPEARAAKIQGTVGLHVWVDPDGVARDVKVVRPLDPGLDQKAIEVVGRWKFLPGTKNGKPVRVEALIEVNFRPL